MKVRFWPNTVIRRRLLATLSSQSLNPKADRQTLESGHWQALLKRRPSNWRPAVLKLSLAHPEGSRRSWQESRVQTTDEERYL
jgi:hypothetical protein